MNQSKRKIFRLCSAVLCSAAVLANTAFAAEPVLKNAAEGQEGVFVPVIDIPVATSDAKTDLTEERGQLLEGKIADIGNVVTIDEACNTNTRSSNEGYTFTGTIADENGMYGIAPIPLAGGRNLHAELLGPDDTALNYDLYLYEYDAEAGTLGDLADVCIYSNNLSGVLPETVGTVNRTEEQKDYILIVYAESGADASAQFRVNLTLGQGGDSLEPNDNAYHAFQTDDLNTSSESGVTVPNVTLDSPWDVDWYVVNIPDMTEMTGITVKNSNNNTGSADIVYDVFRANGNKLTQVKPVNGIYQVQPGYTYIRATTTTVQEDDIAYNLKIEPVYKLTHISIQITMNDGDLPIQTYRAGTANGLTRYALLGGSMVKATVKYVSDSGHPCSTAQDTITFRITDTAWSSDYMRERKDTDSAKNGVASVTLKCMANIGQYHGVSYMSYDASCKMILTSEQLGELVNEDIFITSRIMK